MTTTADLRVRDFIWKTGREGCVAAARDLLKAAQSAEPYFAVAESRKLRSSTENKLGYMLEMTRLRKAAEKFIEWHQVSGGMAL